MFTFDIFGREYDDSVPVFILMANTSMVYDRLEGRFLLKDGLTQYATEMGLTMGAKEMGEAPAAYQADNPRIGGTYGKAGPATPSTAATAGSPGSFDNDVPADLAALQALGALGSTTAWTAGQHVVLGDASKASWNGTAWVAGAAPAAQAPITVTADMSAATVTLAGGPSDAAATLTVTVDTGDGSSDQVITAAIAIGDTPDDVATKLAAEAVAGATWAAAGAVVTITPVGTMAKLTAAVA